MKRSAGEKDIVLVCSGPSPGSIRGNRSGESLSRWGVAWWGPSKNPSHRAEENWGADCLSQVGGPSISDDTSVSHKRRRTPPHGVKIKQLFPQRAPKGPRQRGHIPEGLRDPRKANLEYEVKGITIVGKNVTIDYGTRLKQPMKTRS